MTTINDIYTTDYNLLVGVARKISPGHAEDVVQDVFVKLLNGQAAELAQVSDLRRYVINKVAFCARNNSWDVREINLAPAQIDGLVAISDSESPQEEQEEQEPPPQWDRPLMTKHQINRWGINILVIKWPGWAPRHEGIWDTMMRLPKKIRKLR